MTTTESANPTEVEPAPGRVTRRSFLAGVGSTAVVTGLVATATPAEAAAPIKAPGADVRLGAGTDFGARLSPDGSKIAHDALGVLWVGSSSGGPHRRLTSDFDDIAQPDWSPDGTLIAYQGYREGNFDLWTITPDGSDKKRLTSGPADHREPRWSPDGRRLAFSSDARGS